jgi:hypothetical protein
LKPLARAAMAETDARIAARVVPTEGDYFRQITHMFSRPTNEQYHPAGLIFSTLGAILILFICYKLKIHFPAVNPF